MIELLARIGLAVALTGNAQAATPAAPQQTPVQDPTPYRIQRSLKMGSVDRYQVTVHATLNAPETGGNDIDFTVRVKLRESPKEIHPDGSAVITDVIEAAWLKIADSEQVLPGSEMPGVVQTLDKDGRVSSVTSDAPQNPLTAGIGSLVSRVVVAMSSFYPSQPVRVGDKWKITMPKDKEDPKATGTGEATLLSHDASADHQSFKVKLMTDVLVTMPREAKTHFEGDATVGQGDGKFNALNGVMSSDGALKKGEIALTRLGDDPTKDPDAKPSTKGGPPPTAIVPRRSL